MAKYRVLAPSYIDNRIVQPGEEVTYTGTPGSNLEPIDGEAKLAKRKAQKADKSPDGGAHEPKEPKADKSPDGGAHEPKDPAPDANSDLT